MISSTVIGWSYAPVLFTASILACAAWGRIAFFLSFATTLPIAVVIVWLYALIEVAGYGLNMITVSIAAISLGVGIDYVIHVVERYREEMEKKADPYVAIKAVGGASGIALVGSALSDIAGFLVIMQSSMGFFSTFGLFCAIMIGLALAASMILTPVTLRIMQPSLMAKEPARHV
jgi:predicted RND superfamily exporter protein